MLSPPPGESLNDSQPPPLWLVASLMASALVASALTAGVLCCVRRGRRGTGNQGKPLARAAAELRVAVDLAQHKQQGARLEEQSDLVTERQSEKASATREPVILVVTGIIKKAGGRRVPVPTDDDALPPPDQDCAEGSDRELRL